MKPGEELISLLDTLRINLLQLSDKLKDSGVERTQGLKDAMGIDCPYYRKSLNLFLEQDYTELKNLITATNKQFNLIEGFKDDK